MTVVEVGAFAKATVVLDHSGEARYSGGVAVVVGDGAQVELVSVQDWAPGARTAVSTTPSSAATPPTPRSW